MQTSGNYPIQMRGDYDFEEGEFKSSVNYCFQTTGPGSEIDQVNKYATWNNADLL